MDGTTLRPRIGQHQRSEEEPVPAEAFESLLKKLDDYELSRIVKKRENEPTVKVSLDEL